MTEQQPEQLTYADAVRIKAAGRAEAVATVHP